MSSSFNEYMYIARTRWNLEQEALAIAAVLRALEVEVTSDVLCHRLLLAVASASPRSRLVAWHLSDEIVTKIAQRVARDIADAEREAS